MAIRRVKSAERTIALFELFSAKQRPLTIGEIAAFLEIPQPSVTMLVQNLVALGYIEQDRYARTYTPTIRIALLGSWIHQAYVNERQLELRLNELFQKVGLTTFIGIQNGAHVQYILFIKSQSPTKFDVQAWMTRPLSVSAVGKALLSLKPDEVVRGLVHRANNEVCDPKFRVNPIELLAELQQVRRQGYAKTSGTVLEGVGVIAKPVRHLVGKSPIAVAVGGSVDQIEAKQELILEELGKFVAALHSEDNGLLGGISEAA
ncbi:MAG: hypothetical protein APF78_05320 [Sphingomonadales bacterium BRH_c3]|nr:MAG: hypothetical protein APF78_05320 [Sphingomonadales bacterium BRH_c3]